MPWEYREAHEEDNSGLPGIHAQRLLVLPGVCLSSYAFASTRASAFISIAEAGSSIPRLLSTCG